MIRIVRGRYSRDADIPRQGSLPVNTAVHSSPRERRKVVAATIVGTTIEWYDFFIYSFAANLVFAELFFKPAGPEFATILSLLTIGLSFLFRPLGAFLAGHFGDKLGRRPMLVLTLLLMGGATTLVGLLPTYETIGVAAPVLLMLLRILQGISAGGEWGGAVLMSVEHAPARKRGLYGMFPQLGVPLGMMLASAMLAIMRSVAPGPAFLAWGWRVPFLVSIVLIVVGYVVRRTVEESPVFQEIQEHKEQESAPIGVLFKRYGGIVVLAAMLFAGNNALGYMTTGGYIQGLASRPPAQGGYGFNPVGVQLAILVSAFVWFLSTLFGGWLSDRFGRKRTFILGYVLLLAAAIPLFELVKQGVTGIGLGASLLAIGLGLTYGPQAGWYAEMFPASVRFSGVSISYAIGAIFGGAFAASIAQALLQATGTTWAIVAYLVVMIAIGTTAAILLKDRSHIPLDIGFERSGQWDSWRPGDPTEVEQTPRHRADSV
ncbi:MFS transporter [Enemella evansiae]|uniref:MFS transporter n=1 Tax=Enemella evansiae TaxID=2016499 RepID=A0A255GSM6_9ACTN|nr:MFS transporter [Enemella evansiae]OYO02530.1 MFS transporter [Enemella evansiae]OYO17433.1 MFS transporter [Enemella evansiae]